MPDSSFAQMLFLIGQKAMNAAYLFGVSLQMPLFNPNTPVYNFFVLLEDLGFDFALFTAITGRDILEATLLDFVFGNLAAIVGLKLVILASRFIS